MLRILRPAIVAIIAILCISVKTDSRVIVRLRPAYANTDQSAAWNAVCANFEFPSTATMAVNGSFQAAWNQVPSHTLSLSSALAGILNYIHNTQSVPFPGWDENTQALTNITNWPTS